MSFTVWQVGDAYGKKLARPLHNGAVEFDMNMVCLTKAEWKEFKAQVEELFDIAERNDPA